MYNTVGWTLQSPYARDLYGLQNKLMPLVNAIFEKNMSLVIIWSRWTDIGAEKIPEYVAKEYICVIYTMRQIRWVFKRNSFPTVYFWMLIVVGKEELKQETERLFLEMLEPNHYQRKSRSGEI